MMSKALGTSFDSIFTSIEYMKNHDLPFCFEVIMLPPAVAGSLPTLVLKSESSLSAIGSPSALTLLLPSRYHRPLPHSDKELE